MKKKKSLCESCSNRIVIKFHGKKIRNGVSEKECFYNFTVEVSDNRYKYPANGATPYETHISNVIVDECSFYNKIAFYLKRKKVEESEIDSDDSDDSNGDGSFRNGVTFVNIPGALLP